MPHFDKSGWIIQEKKLVDFRGMGTTHMGNHPMLKLVQILAPVKSCDVLICCREDDFEVHDGLETRIKEFQGPTEEDRMEYGVISHNES